MKIRELLKLIQGGDVRDRKMRTNVIVSLFIKGLAIIVSLVVVPLTLSYLTPVEYGIWLTLNSILVWINYFDIGLSNGLRNKLAEAIAMNDWGRGRAYVSTCFALLTIIVIILIVIFVVANQFLDWNSILNTGSNRIENIRTIVSSVFILCCVSFVCKTIGTVHIANQQPMINDAFICAGQVLSLGLIFLVTQISSGSLLYIALCFSGSPVIVYLISYPYTFRCKYKQLSPSIRAIDFKYTKELGVMGVQFFVLQIACLIIYSTGSLLVAQWFGAEEVTPYNLAYKYLNIALMVFVIVVNPLWTAITDAYVRSEYNWIRGTVKRMTKIWGIFAFFIFLLIACSKVFFKLWIGDAVVIPYTLLFSMGFYIIVDMWNKVFSSFSCGTNRLRIQIYSAVVEAILYIPLARLFTSFMGIAGVSLALAIVSLIPAIVLYLDYRKDMRTKGY